MTTALLIATSVIVLAGSSVTTLPGGTLMIPEGCSAPARIEYSHDVFSGAVDCTKARLRVVIWGDPLYVDDPCNAGPLGAPTRSPLVKIPLSGTDSIIVCTDQSVDKVTKSPRNTLIIDLGKGLHLRAEIRTAQQAYLMLQLAMSYRSSSQLERK